MQTCNLAFAVEMERRGENCSLFLAKHIPPFDKQMSREGLFNILDEIQRCIRETDFEIDRLAYNLSECSVYPNAKEKRRIRRMENELTDLETAMETLVKKHKEVYMML